MVPTTIYDVNESGHSLELRRLMFDAEFNSDIGVSPRDLDEYKDPCNINLDIDPLNLNPDSGGKRGREKRIPGTIIPSDNKWFPKGMDSF